MNGAHSLLIPYTREYKESSQPCTSNLYQEIFDVSEKMSKINMKEITRRVDHDIIIVSITNTLLTNTHKMECHHMLHIHCRD